ncbi:ribulose-phosphate 3-epimerase [Galbibacter sp. BG1]|uniref:ribulose-phosphate 3-epimerase n=1 Tax=Galbibacter sp. BG1 TaxID=1170699 RepID=UPI0015BC1007|nr:ribulose-phosphate 3-epimerase [Galbibacter sp. BG1]QLE02066.1 ribulose-phosphate 3-epimerase [Galbibacter sp. BG1]
MKSIKLSPSMMCADFLDLKSELDHLKSSEVASLHIDVMDGSYVSNFALSADLAYRMQEYSAIPLEFHLMVDEVDAKLPLFLKEKENIIIFHPETSRHPVRIIQQIKDAGCKVGIAIDPSITVKSFELFLPLVDVVCVMTVNPGFASQKLIPFCLEKITELVVLREEKELDFKIEVDGNVSWDNIPGMLKVGADILVLGTSSVFTTAMPRQIAFEKLKTLILQNI